MQTHGLDGGKPSNLILPGTNLIVPKKVADDRNVQNATVKEYFRLEGFKPTHDFVLVETLYDYRPPEDVEIHIPSAIKNQQHTAKVIAVGDGGMMPNGVKNYCCCNVGDLVFVAKGNYPVFKEVEDAPGREFKLVHDSGILGIFHQKKAEPLETTEP